MKKIRTILFVVSICSLILSCFALWQTLKTNAFIEDTKKQVVELKIAKKLINKECWYVVNENTVTSKPNNCGEIVYLGKTLHPLGGEGFIMNPITPNAVVRFSVLTEPEKVLFRESHDYLFGNNLVVCRLIKNPQ